MPIPVRLTAGVSKQGDEPSGGGDGCEEMAEKKGPGEGDG